MKRVVPWWPWLLLFAGAGCGQLPPSAPAKPFTFESGRTPYAAAICIARNAKNAPNVTAEERLLAESAWEVLVRESTGSAETLAVAEVHNHERGSVVSLRVTSSQPGDPIAFARRLMADCQARMIDP